MPRVAGLSGTTTVSPMRRSPSARTVARLRAMWLIVLLTWQALRGQSIIAPDGATWTVLFTLLGSALLLSGGAYLRHRVEKNG